MIRLKRVYEIASKDDGFRILIDRLWPRGLSRDRAKIDLWMKEISPSDDLRKWFHHDVRQWNEFKNRYFQELDEKKDLIRFIAEKNKSRLITLVYGAKDQEFNNGVALLEYLEATSAR